MKAASLSFGHLAFRLVLAAPVFQAAAQMPLSAPTPSSSAAQAFDSLTSRGLGAVRLGMSEAQVRRAFGRPLTIQSPGPEHCLTLTTPTGDIAFTLKSDRLRLIEIEGVGIATRSGLAVGMPLARAKRIFGTELEIGTNFYDDATTEAMLWEADHRHGVRFTAKDGWITEITAGDEALQWVEGCF
jgi:hypothetical protein